MQREMAPAKATATAKAKAMAMEKWTHTQNDRKGINCAVDVPIKWK